jgi:hypothetical protein
LRTSIWNRLICTSTMSGSAYCVTDLQKAIDCVASNTDSCRSCLPIDDFAEVFPERLEDQLRITLAFVPPYQPGFCDEANSRLCAYHEQSLVRQSTKVKQAEQEWIDPSTHLTTLLFSRRVVVKRRLRTLSSARSTKSTSPSMACWSPALSSVERKRLEEEAV